MSAIRKLAGQTAVYGVSTIIGRGINFLLTPLFSYLFGKPADLGTNTEFYSYIAFLNVVFTYGMETGLFNFLSKESNKPLVYSTALRTMLVSTILLTLPFILCAKWLSGVMRYPDHPEFITWCICIVATDALMALPFAKMREENRAKRFAVLKLLYIFINVSVTLFFVSLCKSQYENNPHSFFGKWYDPSIGIGYAFIANLVASSICLLILSKEYLKMRFGFDRELLKRMLAYSLPLLIVGLAGMVNEVLDKILIKYILPPGIAEAQVGIYGTCYKLAILMTIFAQAFRYAAEPFFFARAKESESREIYARVMTFFILFCLTIFLGTMLNISWIQYLVGPQYRSGLKVVPILLLANMCLGVYFNLSIWYKLTGRTRFGMWLTLAGAVITLALNFIWIPSTGYFAGYMGSAWATFICYCLMMVMSYFIGQKYFPVPYRVWRALGYGGLALGLYFLGSFVDLGGFATHLVFCNALFVLFVIIVFLIEKPFRSIGGRRISK